MSKVLNINADQFEKEVIQSKTPVLVDFWAPWCMPCKMMGPILDKVAKDLGEKASIIKSRKEGKWVYYNINNKEVVEILKILKIR